MRAKNKILSEIMEGIKFMDLEGLNNVADYVEYLKEKELDQEILSNKKLIKEAKNSRKAWAEGKKEYFVDWDRVKKG